MAILLSHILFFFREMETMAFPLEAKSLELRKSCCIIPLFYRISRLLIAALLFFISFEGKKKCYFQLFRLI